MTPSRQAVFEAAAARWSQIVAADLSDVDVASGSISANQACGYGEDAIVGTIDDLLIVATVVPIDGIDGILGSAGPRYLRTNGLPYIGCMKFDSADIASMEADGTFADVILHEMGHVLGIGTLWENQGLVNNYQPSSACDSDTATFTTRPEYLGSGANTEYANLGGSGHIPIEDEYLVGTRCAHWDEGELNNELMTGWVEALGTVMPLSKITAASLEDMGYTVDKSATDNFAIPGCAPNCPAIRLASVKRQLNEILLMPINILDSNGQIIPLTSE